MAKKCGYLNKNRFKIVLLTGSSILFLVTAFQASKTFANEEKKDRVNTTVLFQPPSGEEPPKDTEGGGSRDDSNSCDRGIADGRPKSTGDLIKRRRF